jgi:transposase
LDTLPIPAQTLENYYHINGAQLERHYKDHLSDYHSWEQLSHAEDWLLFPQNIGSRLSIDETTLSDGELYTIVTNKAAKGRKGAILAIVAGTAAEKVIEVLEQLPEELRNKVEEITLDMADSMRKIVRRCFPHAIRVIDRFHVQKLAHDALQEMRIAHRWDAINMETEAKEQAKLACEKYIPELLENGRWYNQVAESGFKSFNTIAATVYEHYDEILNLFINRSTNASTESFNAKIKAFRASLREITDIKFFLFRLANIYA